MAWTLLSTDAAVLKVFERQVGDDFRNRFNSDLYEFLNGMDVVQHIKIQRLRWLGHAARWAFDARMCGSRRREGPYIRRKDQIKEALASIDVTNWRRCARSREAWNDILRQAEIC